MLRVAVIAGLVGTGLPVQAVTLPSASFHGGPNVPLDLPTEIDWDDDGAIYDGEVTQEHAITTDNSPISVSSFLTFGNTLSFTGEVSFDLFNPYLRLGIEASTPPNPDAT